MKKASIKNPIVTKNIIDMGKYQVVLDSRVYNRGKGGMDEYVAQMAEEFIGRKNAFEAFAYLESVNNDGGWVVLEGDNAYQVVDFEGNIAAVRRIVKAMKACGYDQATLRGFTEWIDNEHTDGYYNSAAHALAGRIKKDDLYLTKLHNAALLQ